MKTKTLRVKFFQSIFCLLIMPFLSQFCSGCITHLPQEKISGPKTYFRKTDIRTNGISRNYLVHVAKDYNFEKPLPLVVAIHGAFSTAKEFEKQTGFSTLADKEGFIVLYPNGIGILGIMQHWNSGFCCGKAAKENIDDIGFLEKSINDLSGYLNIDRTRIYMVGFSNGGMLAYRFAAEKSHMVAAIAAVAATIGGKSSADSPELCIPAPVIPVPLIILHGSKDESIPYEGGSSMKHMSAAREYMSVADSVDFWIRHNGCQREPAQKNLYDENVLHEWWGKCRNNSAVELYLIKNCPHIWPDKYSMAAFDKKNALKGFDAAEIIWSFLKNYQRAVDAK